MAKCKNAQRSVSQKQVVKWFKQRFGEAKVPPQKKIAKKDNRGPDAKLCRNGKTYYFEAIAFSDTTKGGRSKRWKNQADFWKAFGQAISRLNPKSEWAVPNVTVILLPQQYVCGWRYRVSVLGERVWSRIGHAFPELEIWFISKEECHEFSWSNAFDASANKKGEKSGKWGRK